MPLVQDPEEKETRYLLDFVDPGGRRVLEIGCGDGRLTWRYASLARRVAGIDPDRQRLEAGLQARPAECRPKVLLAQATSEALPFRRQSFDLAILGWSL